MQSRCEETTTAAKNRWMTRMDKGEANTSIGCVFPRICCCGRQAIQKLPSAVHISEEARTAARR